MRVYLNPRLLNVEEVGYLALDPLAANLFFQLVSARHQKGSMPYRRTLREFLPAIGEGVHAGDAYFCCHEFEKIVHLATDAMWLEGAEIIYSYKVALSMDL